MGKRNANGDGTIRQRKDGRWEYMVVVGCDENHKAIRKSFYDKTKTGAKNKYKEWLKQPSTTRVEKVKTVGDWASVWLDTYKKDKVAFGTYNNYKMYVERHIIPLIGQLKFENVKPAHIERVMNNIAGMSKSAHQHVKTALNGIFETAIDNHFCTANPCRKIKAKKDVVKEPEVFTANEIKSILSVADSVPDGYIIELLLYTGMRLGEAAALQWDDIDTKEEIINIRRSVAKKEGGGFQVKATKSGKERQIGVTDKLHDLISRIPRNGNYVLSRSKYDEPNTYSLGDRYKSALKAINSALPPEDRVKLLSAHKCRHTYATYLLKGGANLRQVQQLLGHSTITVTEIYTHIDTEEVKKSVANLPY